MNGIAKVLERVKALRALATSSNVHEAAAAAAQADALIQKHRLSEAELEATGEGPRETIIESDTPIDRTRRLSGWKQLLASKLAAHYGCYVFSRKADYDADTTIETVGRPSDIEAVRYMYAWLSTEITRLSSQERGAPAKNAFRLGAAVAVTKKLGSPSVAQSVACGTSAGLTIANRAAEAQAWATTAHGVIGERRGGASFTGREALRRGMKAGDGIHLGATLPSGGRALPGGE